MNSIAHQLLNNLRKGMMWCGINHSAKTLQVLFVRTIGERPDRAERVYAHSIGKNKYVYTRFATRKTNRMWTRVEEIEFDVPMMMVVWCGCRILAQLRGLSHSNGIIYNFGKCVLKICIVSFCYWVSGMFRIPHCVDSGIPSVYKSRGAFKTSTEYF